MLSEPLLYDFLATSECWDSAINGTVLHFYLITLFIFTFGDAAVSSSAGVTDVTDVLEQNNNNNNNNDRLWGRRHTTHHSPQSGKRGTAHGGGKYAAEVIVGESCVHQSNRLVLFVIRRGDPPVRTCIARIGIPARLHGTQGNDMKAASTETCTGQSVEKRGRRAGSQVTSQSRCFFFVISATSSSSRSCKY